jgi:hypothetical protein
MSARLWNWRLWAGFALALIALLTYVSLFLNTRAVFWPCLALSVIAAFLLVSGTRRAFRQPQLYRGKIAAPLFCSLVLVIFAGFGFASFEVFKNFPVARRAPKVGQPAPQFTLVDSTGKDVSLAELLSEPVTYPSGSPSAPKGVLVVFYRGYW